jgi:F0F1-type ATP synthase assembly protein I
MGTIADRFGVSASFLIIGGFMLMLCTAVALIIRRVGKRASLDEALAGATD